MKLKITALALGLLLLVVPGAFAQYGGPGGTQTFTVPTLTVNPGPLTVSGTFTIGGDLSLGSGAQLLIDDGTEGAPGLGFVSDPTTGVGGAAGAFNVSLDGAYTMKLLQSGTSTYYDLKNPNTVTDDEGVRFRLTDTYSRGYWYLPDTAGSGTYFHILSIPGSTGTQIDVAAGGTDAVTVRLQSPDNAVQPTLGWYNNTYATSLSLTGPANPSAANVVTLPDLTGTAIVSGATNVETGTTTIASDTALNLHSTLAVTIDGDSDNNNTGAVTLTNDNDTQQVLLTTTGVSVISDSDFAAQVDAGDGNVGTLDVAPTAFTADITDGTDEASVRIDATSVLIDADVDDDIDGVLTLQSNNELVKLELDAVGAGGLRGTTTGAGGQITMNSASTIYLAGDSDTDNSGDATLTGDYVYITGDQAADATGDVVISNGSGSAALTLSGGEDITGIGRNIWTPQDFDVADSGDGNPGTGTLNPNRGTVICNCADANGCTVTMGETGAVSGQMVEIVTETATPNLCNFADTAGVSELAGAFAADQWDSLKLVYIVDRWVEVSRSDN
jgi:hypothetical protein